MAGEEAFAAREGLFPMLNEDVERPEKRGRSSALQKGDPERTDLIKRAGQLVLGASGENGAAGIIELVRMNQPLFMSRHQITHRTISQSR